MSIDGELVWLIARWALTILAFISIFFVVSSFGSKENPGLIGFDGEKWFSLDALLGIAELATLTFVIGFGAYGLLWYLPEWVPEYEAQTRGGAALTFGFFGAMFLYETGKRMNKMHKAQIGKNEALADIKKHFWRLARSDGKAIEALNAMIDEIEKGVRPSDSWVEYRAREVRVAYLEELIRAVRHYDSRDPSTPTE